MDVDSSQVVTALLTEHLEYTPLSLVDDVINAVNNTVYQGITSLETGLHAIPPQKLGFKPNASSTDPEPDYLDARQEIEEGLHKLETLLGSAVDKNFDKFEIYVLRSVLGVPQDLAKWIRLSHYEDLQYPLPAKATTPEYVQLLRRKLFASRKVTSLLVAEHTRNEKILDKLRQVSTAVSFHPPEQNYSFLLQPLDASSLSTPASGTAQQPITTSTAFAQSQLPALRAVLADLRPKLLSLRALEPNAHSAKDERRGERRVYIEQQTTSHLHRNGQAVSQKGTITLGRNFEEDEIEAVEKMVSTLDPS